MRKILATVAVATMSVTAFAGGNLDFRGDYKSPGGDQASAASAGFQTTRARLNLSGKVNEMLTAKAQYSFETNAINSAEMIHKMDGMTLTFGKIDDSALSGFEGLRSTADQYFQSIAYMKPYAAGMAADFTVGEGSVKVTLFNDGFNASPTNKGTPGFGIAYRGTFGALGVMANMNSVPEINGTASVTDSYNGVGVSYKVDALKLSVDYLMNTYASGSTYSQVAKDATKNSLVAQFDYDMGNWIPQLKFESSTMENVKAGNTGKNNLATVITGMATTGAYTGTVSQMSLGAEYHPTAGDNNFRYHVMYQTTDVTVSGLASLTQKSNNNIYAGVRMVADFLK